MPPQTRMVTGNTRAIQGSVQNVPPAHPKDCVKTVQRRVWKDYEELADDARYTPKYQSL